MGSWRNQHICIDSDMLKEKMCMTIWIEETEHTLSILRKRAKLPTSSRLLCRKYYSQIYLASIITKYKVYILLHIRCNPVTLIKLMGIAT
jgi:hypothetical protein